MGVQDYNGFRADELSWRYKRERTIRVHEDQSPTVVETTVKQKSPKLPCPRKNDPRFLSGL